MIEAEGYKAFRGTMLITPKKWQRATQNCGRMNERSFTADVCTIIDEG